MPRKLSPLHYIIVSGEGTGDGTVECYTGAQTERAMRARLKTERCSDDRWATIYRLLYVSVSPDGNEVVGTYEDIECPGNLAHFAWE